MTISVIRMRECENEQMEIDFELEDKVSREISPTLLLMKISEQSSNLTYIGGIVSKKTHCLEDFVTKIEEEYYRCSLVFFNGRQGRFSLSPIGYFKEEHEDDDINIVIGDVSFSKEEFFELTRPKLYPVYLCNSRANYAGYALVAATSVEEANKYIQEFKKSDPCNNFDSFGYEDIDASDCMENLLAKKCGILYYGIRYFYS